MSVLLILNKRFAEGRWLRFVGVGVRIGVMIFVFRFYRLRSCLHFSIRTSLTGKVSFPPVNLSMSLRLWPRKTRCVISHACCCPRPFTVLRALVTLTSNAHSALNLTTVDYQAPFQLAAVVRCSLSVRWSFVWSFVVKFGEDCGNRWLLYRWSQLLRRKKRHGSRLSRGQ